MTKYCFSGVLNKKCQTGYREKHHYLIGKMRECRTGPVEKMLSVLPFSLRFLMTYGERCSTL